VQYKVAILCRRLHGKYLTKKAEHLGDRVKELTNNVFDGALRELMQADKATLADKYNNRDIE